MLEIKLSLPYGHIYVGGQTISCSLTFVNNVEYNADNGTPVEPIYLSWATVQLECVASLSAKAAAVSKLSFGQTNKGRKNSLPEIVIFQGSPKLLFCECNLGPENDRIVEFSEQLPTDAPPSFDGDAVKISYRLSIGVQRPNQPIKLKKIPFRVLPLPSHSSAFQTESLKLQRSGTKLHQNPFLEDLDQERDIALSSGTATQAPPSPIFDQPISSCSRTYTINAGMNPVTKEQRLVGSLTISKQVVKIGGAIVGMFDFGRSNVDSLRWSAKLCCEELVPTAGGGPVSMGVNVVSKQEEICVNSVISDLFLPIPPDQTPTFESGIVQLKWRVHFEFTLLKPGKNLAVTEHFNADGGFTTWHLLVPGDGSLVPSPQMNATETLTWNMDIKLMSANPRSLNTLHYISPISSVTVQ